MPLTKFTVSLSIEGLLLNPQAWDERLKKNPTMWNRCKLVVIVHWKIHKKVCLRYHIISCHQMLLLNPQAWDGRPKENPV
jgi:hypothetical protein